MWYFFVVDIGLPTGSTAEHRARLAWFAQHEGEIRPMSGLVVDQMLLAHRPKGIYKPAGWDYALSIRINLRGHYNDGRPTPLDGGGWALRYEQEGSGPADLERLAANRALITCMRDQMPVGVLREVSAIGRQTQYEVLGLATPVDVTEGFFTFVNSPAGSVRSVREEAVVRAEFDAESAADAPGGDYDARLRVRRQVVARQGQSQFRADLIAAYGGRCAITACDAAIVLEAAHLRPYRGPASNVVPNGLLLRADVHTLLDLHLLAMDPGTRTVNLSRHLAGTQYEELSGRQLAEPSLPSQRPSRQTLDAIWHDFQQAELQPILKQSFLVVSGMSQPRGRSAAHGRRATRSPLAPGMSNSGLCPTGHVCICYALYMRTGRYCACFIRIYLFLHIQNSWEAKSWCRWCSPRQAAEAGSQRRLPRICLHEHNSKKTVEI